MINGRISTTQLFVFLFVSVFTNMITAPFLLSEGEPLWSAFLPLIAQGIMFIIILSPTLIYSKAAESEKRFPEWLSVSVKLLYGLYFLYLTVTTVITLSDFSDELSGSAVNKYIIVLAALIGGVYAAYQGIEAIMRFSYIIFAALMVSSLLLVCFVYPAFDPSLLTPVSEEVKSGLLTSTYSLLSLSPHLAAVFLLSSNTKGSLPKSAFIWSLLSVVFMGGMFILICGSSGEYLREMKYPLIHSIDTSGTLQRFDPIFIGTAVSCVFCSLSFSLCIARGCIDTAAENIGLKKYAFPTAVFIMAVISYVVNENTDAQDILRRFSAPVCAVFAYIIPFFAVVSIYLRRLSKRLLRKLRGAAAMIIALVVFTAFSSGCGIQLNKQSIVQGMAVDHNENGYTLTCITLDTKTEKSDNAVRIIRSDGISFDSAIAALESEQGSRVLLSQCLFLIMDTEATDRSSEIISSLSDNRQVMKSLNIMTTEENAGELIENAVTKLGYDSETINMLTASNAVNTHSVRCSLFDYLVAEKENCAGSVVPSVITDKKTNALKTDGGIVLDGKGRIVSRLDENEALTVMLLKNSGNIFFFEKDEEEYRLTSTSASIIPHFDSDIPKLDVSVSYKAEKSDNTDNEINAFLSGSISAILDKTARRECDIFSLIHKSAPAKSLTKAEYKSLLKALEYNIVMN